MSLTWSTSTTSSGGSNAVKTKFRPNVLTPEWKRQWLLMRYAWFDEERDLNVDGLGSPDNKRSIYNPNSNATMDAVLCWDPSHTPPMAGPDTAVYSLALPRTTAFASLGAGLGFSYTADGHSFYDEYDIIHRSIARTLILASSNPVGCHYLFDATAATELANWFYPTPTHMLLTVNASSAGSALPAQLKMLTNAAPVHSRTYIQPFIRGLGRGIPKDAGYNGIGYMDSDGSRLLESALGFFRPDTNQSLLSWIPYGNPSVYGLPAVEVSSAVQYVSTTGATGTLTYKLKLTEFKFDGSSATSYIATGIATAQTTYASGGNTVDEFVATQVDSGHAATLSADCIGYGLALEIDTSPTFSGSVLSNISNSGANFGLWYKRSCNTEDFGTSGALAQETGYLPGLVYDPYA